MVLTLALVLAAAPVKVTAHSFTTAAADAERAGVWSERFAEVLRRNPRLEVTSAADIQQLLGVERQRALLGCETAGPSCLTEIANALGAEGLLVGSITRSGSEEFVVALKILRTSTGKVWWSASERVSSERALLDWLDRQAVEAGEALAPAPPTSPAPWIVGGAGVAAVGVGVTMLTLSNTVSLTAVRAAGSPDQLSSAIDAGRTQGTVGVVCLSVGAAALVGAVIWGLAGVPAEAPRVAVVPTTNGAFVSVGGAF